MLDEDDGVSSGGAGVSQGRGAPALYVAHTIPSPAFNAPEIIRPGPIATESDHSHTFCEPLVPPPPAFTPTSLSPHIPDLLCHQGVRIPPVHQPVSLSPSLHDSASMLSSVERNDSFPVGSIQVNPGETTPKVSKSCHQTSIASPRRLHGSPSSGIPCQQLPASSHYSADLTQSSHLTSSYHSAPSSTPLLTPPTPYQSNNVSSSFQHLATSPSQQPVSSHQAESPEQLVPSHQATSPSQQPVPFHHTNSLTLPSSQHLHFSPPSSSIPLLSSSYCSSIGPTSLVSSMSLPFPQSPMPQYLPLSSSQTAARIIRSVSLASASHYPSTTARRSPGLRLNEASSMLDQLINTSSYMTTSSLHRGQRVHSLALTHLASHDVNTPFIHSPPPSYDQLCNPDALPTYQEATQASGGTSRKEDSRAVFTLPSNTEPSNTEPLLQDGDRSVHGGMLATLAAELSDSEGGYSTILDAIPYELARDPCPAVPVRFLSTCSMNRLKPPKIRIPCITSVCNKAHIRKELNSRWPFIAGAYEDEQCPGLIVVECSSHLTVAHLPELPRGADSGGVRTGGSIRTAGIIGHSPIGGDQFSDVMASPPTSTGSALTTFDLDTAALSSQVFFYLCGKCVGFDSFDRDTVQSHIEYDCLGPQNKWSNMSELYLVLRAVAIVLLFVFAFLVGSICEI